MKKTEKKVTKRVFILSLWIVPAIVLILVFGLRLMNERLSSPRATTTSIESAVEHVLREYRIDPKSVKVRRTRVGGTMTERRISLSPTFNTLSFNRDLSRAVAEHGATVVAREKSDDTFVTMDVKRDGMIVERIVLVAVGNEKRR